MQVPATTLHTTHSHEACPSDCPPPLLHYNSISQSQCLSALPSDDKSGVCACFQQLGNCLHNAGCLNGTYEDLHDQYCEVGDSYCCSEHGEFNGCGVVSLAKNILFFGGPMNLTIKCLTNPVPKQRDDFSGSELCLCEQLYGGTYCNTTNAVCSSGSSCNVCSTCCRDYSGDTCDACVQDECDQNVCSDDSSCSVCSSCCKSYLSGPDVQADCNICVEQVC